ncbi:hypothetical protein [Ralstonia insidiosa]|uniref:Uncharacterized protein n=1 Tax=Ralstonia insidiosa TaxID=190721 RepID=A0A848PAZ2_9RALS|nr:hypothetical protein [Ralstonia insidiosa]NMV41824.1 hypothetical protein [Ralstonia insidiosa]
MMEAMFEIDTPPSTISAFVPGASIENTVTQKGRRYVRLSNNGRAIRAHDIAVREGVRVSLDVSGVAPVVDQFPSPEFAKQSQEMSNLLVLIDQFASDGFSCVGERASTISKETAQSARSLFSSVLPAGRLPKIAPDGEGGLIALWDSTTSPIVLVIDNWRLHLVKNAATPQAEYFDDLPFDGESVPQVVSESIPR